MDWCSQERCHRNRTCLGQTLPHRTHRIRPEHFLDNRKHLQGCPLRRTPRTRLPSGRSRRRRRQSCCSCTQQGLCSPAACPPQSPQTSSTLPHNRIVRQGCRLHRKHRTRPTSNNRHRRGSHRIKVASEASVQPAQDANSQLPLSKVASGVVATSRVGATCARLCFASAVVHSGCGVVNLVGATVEDTRAIVICRFCRSSLLRQWYNRFAIEDTVSVRVHIGGHTFHTFLTIRIRNVT